MFLSGPGTAERLTADHRLHPGRLAGKVFGVIAVFAAPEARPDTSTRAVRAARHTRPPPSTPSLHGLTATERHGMTRR
jgi:hypothetical protein